MTGTRGRGAHLAWPGTAKGSATGWRWDWKRAPNGTETDGEAVLLCVHAGRREPREKKKKKPRETPHNTKKKKKKKGGVWLGPRDGHRGQGQHGRRHRSRGRGREGSDPC